MVVTESGRFFLHVLVIDEHLKHVKGGGVASLSVHLYTLTFMIIQCSDILYHISRTTTGQEGTEYHQVVEQFKLKYYILHFIEPQCRVN